MAQNTITRLRTFGVLSVAFALLLPTVGDTVPDAVRHSGISIHRNDDGSVKLGPRFEAESSNWSGYVVFNFATGDTYSSAMATWTVPTAAYQAPSQQLCHVISGARSSRNVCFTSNATEEYSAIWVGIGGTCEDAKCSRSDSTLIQLGTEQDAAENGSTEYYPWYEMLPHGSVYISKMANCRQPSCAYTVKPGDAITASLKCTANCEPGETQTWALSMANATQKWTYATTVSYKSTLASAEWITEAPSSNAGVLPLANFSKAQVDPTDNGGENPGIMNLSNGTVGPNAIMLVDPYGETSIPSPVVSLDAFATCWGDNPKSIASCPSP